jgi:hypothetical protein
MLQAHCVVGGLTWGDVPPETLLQRHGGPPPDLIIGADVFYDARNLDNLLSTVDAFFECEPACVFLVAYQERGGTLGQLATALAMWHMEIRPVKQQLAAAPAKRRADADDGGDGNESDVDNDDDDEDHNRFASTRLIEIFRAAR